MGPIFQIEFEEMHFKKNPLKWVYILELNICTIFLKFYP